MNKALFAGALIAATLAPVAAQAQDRNHDRREWREDRRDARHDRREWREHHRRNDRWNAPFRYRSFSVGVIAPRAYWAPNYYVNDWGRDRLPRPGYGYYRYVRHYGDLLLINTRNGRVIRVYRNYYR